MYDPEDQDLSLAYANRAICYLRKKEYYKVIEDCGKALEIRPTYIKALDRRARAYDAVGEKENAIRDLLAGFYLSNETLMM